MNELSDVIKKILYCPHCSNTSIQTLLIEQSFLDKYYGSTAEDIELRDSTYSIIKCETCSEVLIYLVANDEPVNSRDTPFGDLLFPKFPGDMAGVPDSVRNIYVEAIRVQNLSAIAFVILARRTLEEICLEKKVSGKNLAEKLKNLVVCGDFPPVLNEASSFIRFIGNNGAHASNVRITAPQTWAINDFLKIIIEYTYIMPEKIKKFKEHLDSWKSNA